MQLSLHAKNRWKRSRECTSLCRWLKKILPNYLTPHTVTNGIHVGKHVNPPPHSYSTSKWEWNFALNETRLQCVRRTVRTVKSSKLQSCSFPPLAWRLYNSVCEKSGGNVSLKFSPSLSCCLLPVSTSIANSSSAFDPSCAIVTGQTSFHLQLSPFLWTFVIISLHSTSPNNLIHHFKYNDDSCEQ